MKKSNRLAVCIFVCIIAFGSAFVFSSCDQNGEDDNETSGGGDGGGTVSSCIPCGGIDLSCDICQITGCPKCFEFDDETGGMKMVYDDGSYYITNEAGTEMIFYDSTGRQCFKMLITIEGNVTTTAYYSKDDELCYEMISDSADNTITYDVGDKEYVYHGDDESWDCPDGTTWVADESCGDVEVEEPEGPNTAGTGECPPVTDLCDGADLPLY